MIKIASKSLILVLLWLSFSLPLANTTSAMSQISLQNSTNFWLYLYIDGNFGCGPVMPSGFCVSSVTPGSHVLDARKKGESITVIMSEAVNIGDGTSPTWTVTIEDPDKALIKKLDGARYISRSENSYMRTEDSLDIKGTIITWSHRLLWATTEGGVAQSIATGTNGFRQETIGVWQEYGRMQIVGREARYHIVHRDGSVQDEIFTIGEDGNIVTEVETWKGQRRISTFYRQ